MDSDDADQLRSSASAMNTSASVRGAYRSLPIRVPWLPAVRRRNAAPAHCQRTCGPPGRGKPRVR